LYLTPCGKSMLAQPFAGLLRPMTVEEALQGKEIDTHTALDDAAAAKFLNIAAARLGWSARSTHRALKVARTIADLAGAATTQTVHVAEAVQYRRALATTSGA
jgi:magnesium chelatase family protein